MSKLNKKITKLFQTKAASIDEANSTVTFKISDAQQDRQGEIVDQGSWNIDSYKNNPVLLWGHDPSEPENVLGQGVDITYNATEDAHYASVSFDTDINDKAAMVFKQIVRGTLRTVSIGFIPHTYEIDQDVPVLKDIELLEISVVPIPANPRAIALALAEGTMSQKDANYLIDGMKKEIPVIEKLLENSKSKEQAAMSDEQFKTLNDTLGNMTTLLQKTGEALTSFKETADNLGESVTALADKVKSDGSDDDESKGKPAAGKDDPAKGGNDDDDNNDDDDAGNGDGTDNDDDKGDDQSDQDDDTAKGGSDDQSGADDDDEIDEDAELTPEQEAEVNSEWDRLEAEAATAE